MQKLLGYLLLFLLLIIDSVAVQWFEINNFEFLSVFFGMIDFILLAFLIIAIINRTNLFRFLKD